MRAYSEMTKIRFFDQNPKKWTQGVDLGQLSTPSCPESTTNARFSSWATSQVSHFKQFLGIQRDFWSTLQRNLKGVLFENEKNTQKGSN